MTTLTVARLRECASAVLQHVHVEDVHVVQCQVKGAHPIVDGPFDVDSSLVVKAVQRDGAIDAYSLYEVIARRTDSVEAWRVRLEVVGVWGAPAGTPEFDSGHLNCFALSIGMMTLHPYAREAVQTAVSRLGYPPFTLEMIASPTGGADDDVVEVEPADSSDE